MTRYCNKFILASSDEQTLAVPIATDNFFGVFAHGWHFSFVLLIVEVEISLLVSTREDGVSQRPFHPSNVLLLVIEVKLIDHTGRKWSP
jgi:hypothetical protein